VEFPFDFRVKEDKAKPKEGRTSVEKELRLETAGQRALEASLFIDKKFLDVAVITGEQTPPELLFGRSAWKGYTDARALARQSISQELSVDLIKRIHEKVANPVEPKIAGKIRNSNVRAGDYNDPTKAVRYTNEQIESIKQNPHLVFEPTDGANTGFIHYPFTKDGQNTRQYIEELLEEVCTWYNAEIKNPNADPHRLAAILQRRIISIHPFLDANGTTSRLLMNWSLEKTGAAPSAIDNPSSDITTSEDEWTQTVRNGSKKYEESKRRLKALEACGIEDIAFVLGVYPEKAFYDYIFRYIGKPPRFFSNNGMQDHQDFDSFFTQFINELSEFQKFLQSTTKIGDKQITQGGLISDAFMKLQSQQGVLPQQALDEFFTDVNLFRGGSLDVENVDDSQLLQLLTQYTGVGTGYRALGKSYMSPLSGDISSRQQINESAAYYNKVVAKHYLKTKHPTNNTYGADVRELSQAIRGHVGGGKSVWESPFVSTSFSKSVSESFAGGLAKYGVLFALKAPREGIMLSFRVLDADGLPVANVGTFTHEKEGLIAGGINPNSIEQVRIYEKGKGKTQALFIAERTGNNIRIEDYTGVNLTIRTYVYDQAKGHYEFVSEERPNIPSTTHQPQLLEEPVPTQEIPWKDYSIFDIPEKKTLFDAYSYELEHYASPIEEYYKNLPMDEFKMKEISKEKSLKHFKFENKESSISHIQHITSKELPEIINFNNLNINKYLEEIKDSKAYKKTDW